MKKIGLDQASATVQAVHAATAGCLSTGCAFAWPFSFQAHGNHHRHALLLIQPVKHDSFKHTAPSVINGGEAYANALQTRFHRRSAGS